MWYWQGIFGGFFSILFSPTEHNFEYKQAWNTPHVNTCEGHFEDSCNSRSLQSQEDSCNAFSHPVLAEWRTCHLKTKWAPAPWSGETPKKILRGCKHKYGRTDVPYWASLGGKDRNWAAEPWPLCTAVSHSDIAIPSWALGWRAELAVWAKQCCSSSLKRRLFSCQQAQEGFTSPSAALGKARPILHNWSWGVLTSTHSLKSIRQQHKILSTWLSVSTCPCLASILGQTQDLWEGRGRESNCAGTASHSRPALSWLQGTNQLPVQLCPAVRTSLCLWQAAVTVVLQSSSCCFSEALHFLLGPNIGSTGSYSSQCPSGNHLPAWGGLVPASYSLLRAKLIPGVMPLPLISIGSISAGREASPKPLHKHHCVWSHSAVAEVIFTLPWEIQSSEEICPGRREVLIRYKGEIFYSEGVEPLKQVPQRGGKCPSLNTFEVRLHGALSKLVWWKMSLFTAGGWARWPLWVPSETSYSVILWFFEILTSTKSWKYWNIQLKINLPPLVKFALTLKC